MDQHFAESEFEVRADAASEYRVSVGKGPFQGVLEIHGSGAKSARQPIWIHIGPASIPLTEAEAMEISVALASVVQRRRDAFKHSNAFTTLPRLSQETV